jgi:hypothetical protein
MIGRPIGGRVQVNPEELGDRMTACECARGLRVTRQALTFWMKCGMPYERAENGRVTVRKNPLVKWLRATGRLED